MKEKILDEIYNFCEECGSRECCSEDDCIMYRIEKIVLDEEIDYLTRNDLEELLIIWKQQGDLFGIPYRSGIFKLIDNKQFLCVRDNKKIIAICGYKIMKRNPQIRISHLWVHEDYRRKHIALKLINQIINLNDNNNLDLVVRCKDGAENNYFYDKIKKGNYYTEKMKTVNLRIYTLDREKIRSICNGI